MEVTESQPPPASPQRTTSQATLGSHSPSVKSEKSIFIPSASPLLLRRASCRDYTLKEEKKPTVKRTGSLLAYSSYKNRSNSFRKVAAPATGQISSHTANLSGEVTDQRGREGVDDPPCDILGKDTKRNNVEKTSFKKNTDLRCRNKLR